MRTSQIPEFTGAALADGDDVIANVQISPGTFRLRRVPRNIVGATGPTGAQGIQGIPGVKTILDYGAVCDGVTDDSAAVLAAIADKDANGGAVLIPGIAAIGSAGWTGILISGVSNLTIEGFGENSGFKVLALPSQLLITGIPCAIKLSSCSNVTLRNLSIRGNSIASVAIGLSDTTDVSILDNSIFDCGKAAIFLQSTGTDGLTGCLIAGNRLNRNDTGVQSDDIGFQMSRVSIIGNRVEENNGNGIYLAMANEWIVSDNVVRNNNHDGIGNGRGIRLGVSASKVVISGNLVFDDRLSPKQNTGVLITADTAGKTIDDVVIQGNIFSRNKDFNIQVTTSGGGITNRVAVCNNICNGESVSLRGISVSGGSLVDVVLVGNVCRNHASFDFSATTLPITTGVSNIGFLDGLLPMRLMNNLLAEGLAAPITGTWTQGDRVFNSAATVGQPKSFVCTVSGTPGTWVSEGNL